MSNDDLGTRLSGSLHDHVDQASTGHISAYDVQQRAGRIRRTRRIVTVVAAAAAAAVVVPTALFVSSPGGDNAPGPAASSTPSPSATGPVDVTLPTDPQSGHEPCLDWADRNVLHASDGTARPIDQPYEQFVRVGSLFLGVHTDDEGTCTEADGGGCTVYFNERTVGRAGLTSAHGVTDIVTPDAISVDDVSGSPSPPRRRTTRAWRATRSTTCLRARPCGRRATTPSCASPPMASA